MISTMQQFVHECQMRTNESGRAVTLTLETQPACHVRRHCRKVCGLRVLARRYARERLWQRNPACAEATPNCSIARRGS